MALRYDFNPFDGEAGMEESPNGDYVKWEDYFELLRAHYEKGREVWKTVVSTEVYQDLKFGKYRDILNLLADGEISVGKAAESIVERAGGIEPRLPESTLRDDRSWKERYEELALKLQADKDDFLDLNEYWNGGNGAAVDACQHTVEISEKALERHKAL